MFLLLQKTTCKDTKKNPFATPRTSPNRQLPSLWGHGWLVNALFGEAVHHVFQKKGGKKYNPPHIPPQQATVYFIARRAFLLIANAP